tara:strand:+ start:1688 stop:2080 length:393 start_codon:yes stop_codon:yes gene_type:complete
MNVYQTDAQGYFVGVTTADPDPMLEGAWLIPAGCVTEAPADAPEGSRAKWTGSAWAMEVIPVEPDPEEPEPIPQDVLVRGERDSLLSAYDWTQVADAPVDQAAWATYRQALRDIPAQADFPNTVTWPTKP